MPIKFFCILIISLLVCGCAGTPPQTINLTDVVTRRTVKLSQPLSEITAPRLLNAAGENGLVPGIYIAEKENEFGTFFRGPPFAFFFRDYGSTKYNFADGGFWIPKEKDGTPRLYNYIGTQVITANSLPIFSNDESGKPSPTSGGKTGILPSVLGSTPIAGTGVVPVGMGAALGMGIVAAITADLHKTPILRLPSPDESMNSKIREAVRSSGQ